MSKKIIGLALCSLLLAPWLPTEAQQPAKLPKIGWPAARPSAPTAGYEVFRRVFRDLGYIEGKNIAFEYRSADNKIDRLPVLADELARLKVDVLVAPGGVDAIAAKNATKTIPGKFQDRCRIDCSIEIL